jgi:hypothetical protein
MPERLQRGSQKKGLLQFYEHAVLDLIYGEAKSDDITFLIETDVPKWRIDIVGFERGYDLVVIG